MAKEVKKENEAVVTAVSKTEAFLTENKKVIWGVVCAIVVLACAGYASYKFMYLPTKAEALAQMYKAEDAFRSENYELALKGDDNNLGFEEIINQYGSKAGRVVYLYAAVCELKAGEPEQALSYLSKYSTNDNILGARAEALRGDAYCAKEEYEKAAASYEKAADVSDNVFSASYLLKAGQVYEKLGNDEDALKVYKQIKEDYPQSMEAYDIDKYITRLEVKE